MSEILVVRPSSLGDIVHALALVSDVVRARPGTAIDWVSEEAFVELPAMCPDVRRVIPIALRRWRRSPVSREAWREAHTSLDSLRESSYDAILDLQEQVKGAVVARLARGVRHGFDRDSVREPVSSWFDDVHHRVPLELHFATRCRALAAAALGYVVDGPPRWDLVPPRSADTPPGHYVVALHATSRADKLWPEDRWRALATQWSRAGLATVLPWGDDTERARSARLAESIDDAIVPPRQPLSALAALLSHADLVVGVDTGLTHLAAALGTPTVALFSATDPAGAGVAIAGANARDLGGRGRVPTADEAKAACDALVRTAPGC